MHKKWCAWLYLQIGKGGLRHAAFLPKLQRLQDPKRGAS